MADEIKTTTPTAYEIHKGDKVVSKDGRHGKIIEVEQTAPLCYKIDISFEFDYITPVFDSDKELLAMLKCPEHYIIDFSKATEKSLKVCCPDLYRINNIVFGNRLTAEEIQNEIINLINNYKKQIDSLKYRMDYERKREWRLKYQMPEPTYGTPMVQDNEDKDE